MSDETETTAERPLVTLAVFAYNQEKYIREAVEGAFSQTYEPLEIILSDDCSSDRTFEIMQEMAAAYEGPHRVVLNRSSVNVGTIDHVIGVARRSRGEFLIVAAGDDVSFPDRATHLVNAFVTSRAAVVYSGCVLIDDVGRSLNSHFQPSPMPAIQSLFEGTNCARRYDGLVRNVPGYSAAYARNLVAALPFNGKHALNEDALTTVIANAQGLVIEAVNRPLLRYRVSGSSVSMRLGDGSVRAIEAAEIVAVRFSRSSVSFYPYLINLIRSMEIDRRDCLILEERFAEMHNSALLRCEVWKNGILGRVKLLFKTGNKSDFKMIVSRLFGLKAFAVVKSLSLKIKQQNG